MRYSERLMVGEVPSGVLGFQGFAAAADVNRVAGLVTYQDGRAVFKDGKLGPIFSSVSQVQMSADGNSVIYTGTKNEKHYIVLNGDVSPGYDWVGKLCLSPDGKLIVYSVMKETSGHQEYWIVCDGIFGDAFEYIGDVILHPHKHEVAYIVGEGASERVVVGKHRLMKYQEVGGLQFSPAGRLYYWGFKDGDWWLCDENGAIELSEGNDPPIFGGLLFGPNGELGFCFCKHAQWYVRYGAQVYGPWPGFQPIVGSPTLSDDFQFITYVIQEGERTSVCKNQIREREFDAVGRPIYKRGCLSYKARLGAQEFLIVNERKGQGYEVIWPEEREFATYLEDVPVISPTSDKIAFLAAIGERQAIVINGAEQRKFSKINGQPLFSPSTDRLAYGAHNGHEEFVIVDSEVLGPFSHVFSAKIPTGLMFLKWSPEFSYDGKVLHFFCVEGRDILKCNVSL